MVTRLESGRMQLNAPGGVPMERVVPQQVDYMTAAREQARGAGAMADIIDRMSQSISAFGKELAAEEAVRYAADNPPDRQQLLIAAGFDEASGQFVKVSEDKSKGAPIPITAFDKAYRKARAEQIAGLLKAEGLNQIANFLTRLDKEGVDKLSSEQISKQIESMISGFEAAARKESPEAAIQVRASLAANGYTAIEKARQLELKAAQSKRFTIFDEEYQSHIRLLEADVDRGFSIDSKTGEKMLIDDMAKLRRLEILNKAIALNDPGLQKEYGAKFDTALRNAKISAVTRFILTDEKLLDNPMLGRMIMTGQLDKMSDVMTDLLNNDMKAVAEINANVDIALNRRENLKKQQAADAKAEAVKQFVPLYQQAVALPEGSKQRKQIAGQIAAIARSNPDAVPLSVLKDLLEPAKAGEGNAAVYFNLRQMIYDNKITDPSQIWALTKQGLSTSNAISALDLFYRTDKQDQKDLDIGISKLAGINVVPGSVVVLDPKGQEFQRRQELVAQSKEIEARYAREGKAAPTPRQILTELETGLEKRRNSEAAKSARKQLDEVWSKQKWINGPISRKNLSQLEHLAKGDQKKERDLAQIKKLLDQAGE